MCFFIKTELVETQFWSVFQVIYFEGFWNILSASSSYTVAPPYIWRS